MNTILAAATVALIFGQAIALGANTAFLASCAALSSLVVGNFVFWSTCREASPSFWKPLAVPLALYAAALGWGAAPLLLQALGRWPGPRPVAPDMAWLELSKLIALGAIFVTGALLGRSEDRRRKLTTLIIGASTLYLLLSFYLWRKDPLILWGEPKGAHAYRFTATLLNANAAACLIGALVLIGVGRLVHSTLSFRRMIWAPEEALWPGLALITVVLGIAGILVTASRVGLAGVVIGGLALIILTPPRSSQSRLRRSLLPALAIIGLGLVVILMVGGAPTFERAVGASDVDIRWQAWRMHAELLLRSPWFGYGLGSFRQLHQANLDFAHALTLWDLGAVHQPLLQAAVEGGAPFALLIAATIVAAAYPAAIAFGRDAPGKRWATSIALAALLILVNSSVDIAMNVPAIASLFALLLGVLAGWGSEATRQRVRDLGRSERAAGLRET